MRFNNEPTNNNPAANRVDQHMKMVGIEALHQPGNGCLTRRAKGHRQASAKTFTEGGGPHDFPMAADNGINDDSKQLLVFILSLVHGNGRCRAGLYVAMLQNLRRGRCSRADGKRVG